MQRISMRAVASFTPGNGDSAPVRTLLLAALALLTTATVASAHTCVHACDGGGGLCRTMAVQYAKGCRLLCDAGFAADPDARRACRADCRTQVVADKEACVTDKDACEAICAMAADPKCADQVCSYSYGDCRRAVTEATRACLKAAGSDGAAMQACVEPGNAGTGSGRAALDECITDMAGGLTTCIGGC